MLRNAYNGCVKGNSISAYSCAHCQPFKQTTWHSDDMLCNVNTLQRIVNWLKAVMSRDRQYVQYVQPQMLKHDGSDEFVAVALALVASENEDSFEAIAANV